MIAADVMTPNPRTVRVTASVRAALDILWTLEFRHLPVVDEEGELVGMLSDRDLGGLMRTFTEGGAPATGVVGDVMSGNVVSVDSDDDLEDVIEKLLEERIGAVPVVDGEGAVVGIISYVDVLRTYADELAGSAGRRKAKTSGRAKPKRTTNGKSAKTKRRR